MNNWMSFFVGVASSLIATYLLQASNLLVKFIPPKFRKSFDREFKNQNKAIRYIKKDAKNSTSVRVITMKGDTFSNPNKSGVLRDILTDGPLNQKYLISDPANPYVLKRGKELNNNTLKSGIENSIECFKDVAIQKPNTHIRLHNEILRFRLIIFDDSLYLSFQSTDTPGRKSPMQRYIRTSSGYSALEAYFEDMWEKYQTNNVV